MWYFNKQKAVPLGILRGARKELLFMRKVSDVLRRICALALCLCMMAQYMPMAGFGERFYAASATLRQTPLVVTPAPESGGNSGGSSGGSSDLWTPPAL